MNEIFDKLLIRFFLIFLFFSILYLYRIVHTLIYRSAKKQIFQAFIPGLNATDTLHFSARIIGIAIILTDFHIDLSSGLLFGLIDLIVITVYSFVSYIASVYIIESIILSHFEFSDEILKRKNFSYAIISFCLAISMAIMLKTIIGISDHSLSFASLAWLFTIVLMGLVSKTYKYLSDLPFNRMIVQKDISIALSYSGFFLGASFIVAQSVNHYFYSLGSWVIETSLRLLLSVIIFPVIIMALKKSFGIRKHKTQFEKLYLNDKELGPGMAQGAIFFAAAYFSVMLVEHLYFGNFYPTL